MTASQPSRTAGGVPRKPAREEKRVAVDSSYKDVIGIWVWSRTAGLPVGPDPAPRRRSELLTASRRRLRPSSSCGLRSCSLTLSGGASRRDVSWSDQPWSCGGW